MQDKLTKEVVESARQFARFGLNVASSAAGYAAEVLRDCEKELRQSSERFQAGREAESKTTSDPSAQK